MPFINENNIPLQKINESFFAKKGIKLYVLREDLTHAEISGNKWRKLKYNLLEAQKLKHRTILTFGGAYSNHIAATAAAGREFGFKTIGIIRGDEILPLNQTLQLAQENGMIFKYISRTQYRANNKYNSNFIKNLKKEFGAFYLVPEGGSNALAVKGCTEITNNINVDFDVVCCACGTGGTIAGIIAAVDEPKYVLGFPALKGGEFLQKDISKLLKQYADLYSCKIVNDNWRLITDFHFGGFAKIKPELVSFIKAFKTNHNILLDFIYTGKMLFGIYEMLKHTNVFDNKTIVVVHTGGLQGNKGFEDRLGVKI